MSSFHATIRVMDDELIEILEYITADGRNHFRDWLEDLSDKPTRARIRMRINRLRLGNFGDSKSIGRGVHELRIQFGPGFRIYFGRASQSVAVLLIGGDKSTQAKDIELAFRLWDEYWRRSK